MRNFIKRMFDLHDIEDLRIGATCGCCGKSIDNVIVESIWPYDICSECIGLAI